MRTRRDLKDSLEELVHSVEELLKKAKGETYTGPIINTIHIIVSARSNSGDLNRAHISRELKKYDYATRNFLYGEEHTSPISIKQSLAFLNPDPILLYKNYSSSFVNKDEKAKPEKDELFNLEMSDEQIEYKVEDETKAYLETLDPNETWENWWKVLQKHEIGKATLWVNLKSTRAAGNSVTSSLLLVFDKGLTLPEQLQIAKCSIHHLHKENLYVYEKELIEKATRSAISQVLLRDLSHNMASHVLNSLTTSEQINKVFVSTDLSIKNGEQLANLMVYLRTMMDFLADVSTSTPTVEVLKSLDDIINGFQEVLILRDRIGGLGVGGFPFGIKVILPDNQNCLVSIPNDVLGCHAFYNILINIIRNTAKHSKAGGTLAVPSNHPQTNFTIEVKDFKLDPTLWEVIIFDDIQQDNIETLVTRRNKELNRTILDPNTNELRLGGLGMIEMDICAAYLRKIRIEEVDDEKFDVDENAINESYCKTKPEYVNTDVNYQWNTLRALNVSGCLGYRLFLMKPSEVLVFDETSTISISIKEKRETLGNKGVLLLDESEAKSYDDQGRVCRITRTYPHQFLIWFTKSGTTQVQIDDFIRVNRGALPHRVIVVLNGEDVTSELHNVCVLAKDCKTTILEQLSQLCNINTNTEDLKVYLWQQVLQRKFSLTKASGEGGLQRIIDDHSVQNLWLDSTKSFQRNFKGNLFSYWFDYHGAEGKDISYSNTLNHYESHPSSVKNWIDLAEKTNSRSIGLALLDSTVQHIVIIDERIQAALTLPPLYGEAWENHFKWANIRLPGTDICDLNQQSFDFDTYKQNLKEWLSKLERDKLARRSNSLCFSNIDFLVIHLGVLEKLLVAKDPNSNKDKDEIKRLVDELFGLEESRSYKLIITSGRGKPSNLPDDISYLNFSIISQYCLNQKLKFLLINALVSARKLSES